MILRTKKEFLPIYFINSSANCCFLHRSLVAEAILTRIQWRTCTNWKYPTLQLYTHKFNAVTYRICAMFSNGLRLTSVSYGFDRADQESWCIILISSRSSINRIPFASFMILSAVAIDFVFFIPEPLVSTKCCFVLALVAAKLVGNLLNC